MLTCGQRHPAYVCREVETADVPLLFLNGAQRDRGDLGTSKKSLDRDI